MKFFLLFLAILAATLLILLATNTLFRPDHASGTIIGTVLLGPTCPVLRDPPDQACADRPFETELQLTSLDGSRVVLQFQSNADGIFSVATAPGEYRVRHANTGLPFPHCNTSEKIAVTTDQISEVSVLCDTGIR